MKENDKTQYIITLEVKKAVTPEQYLKWLLEQIARYRRLGDYTREELVKYTARKNKKAKEYDAKRDEYVKLAREVSQKHKLGLP